MDFKKAKEYMKNGGRVTLPEWTPEDYLYIQDGIVLDDGGNPYENRLRKTELESKDWRKYRHDRECMICGMFCDKDSIRGLKYDSETKCCPVCKESEDE